MGNANQSCKCVAGAEEGKNEATVIDLSKGMLKAKRQYDKEEVFSFYEPARDEKEPYEFQEAHPEFFVSSVTSSMIRGEKKFAMPHVEDSQANSAGYLASNGILEKTDKMNDISPEALSSIKLMGDYPPIMKSHFPDLKVVGPCKDSNTGATYQG